MTDSGMNPGTPDRRSAGRYLWWLVTSQRRRVAAGALLGGLWMVCLTLPPYVLSRAIDDGLRPGRTSALLGWSAALLGVGVVNAWLAIMRHRTMTRIRMDASFRTVRVVALQTVRLGAALPRRVTAGEIVTIGMGDVQSISQTLTITGPGVGAVLSYLVVAALLLSVSWLLAVVVLLGVPLLAVVLGPLLERLQGRESAYREHQGALAARFVDLAGGLRVLNGLGGKEVFAERYRQGSRALQAEGYRVGSVTSWIQALGLGLPTLFLAAVTWLAARMAAQGAITVGELVAVYGYVAVLVVPVAFFIEGGYDLSRGLVAARRVLRLLDLEPELAGSGAASDAPASPAVLRDADSGVEVAPGQLTALVSARPAETAAVVERLGRFTESAATWGDVPLRDIDLARVRDRILVADNEADLFSGTLREVVAGRAGPTGLAAAAGLDGDAGLDATGPDDDARLARTRRFDEPGGAGGADAIGGLGRTASPDHPTEPDAGHGPDATAGLDTAAVRAETAVRAHALGPHALDATAVGRALCAAAARDLVLGLPKGLDSHIDAQGRNLSGGQRQRVRLARALFADPEVLLAVEPTSAVDAHTEAAVADGLRAFRAGRTTVVTGSSPLLLDRADTVYYLEDGRVAAVGGHGELLREHPGYRSLVARGAGDPEPEAADGIGTSDSADLRSREAVR
ncbi:ABC transporter ATP-binding protein [Streptomyces varsoviensis]|uniref:ABC transporter ATP-binding protein n=1 Tax=Streptomyces varsoviensis TaxID=67373 RepID=UPI0033D21457